LDAEHPSHVNHGQPQEKRATKGQVREKHILLCMRRDVCRPRCSRRGTCLLYGHSPSRGTGSDTLQHPEKHPGTQQCLMKAVPQPPETADVRSKVSYIDVVFPLSPSQGTLPQFFVFVEPNVEDTTLGAAQEVHPKPH
jgi:hypothetical protein